MPRLPRRWQWTEAACYHIINRGHNRDTIFADDEDHAHFLGLLADYRQRFAFRLYHYCLMTNHFHLLLQLPDPRQLSTLMAGLLRSYVHHVHRRHGFVGHLFQGRFKSPAIEAETYLLSCGRYIERNPVEAGLVALPWEHRWSSAAAYALGQEDTLLSESPWYEGLAASASRCQELWRSFLLGEDAKEEAIRRGDWVLGSEAFCQQMGEQRGRPARRRGRPRKLQSRRITSQTIESVELP
jgi:putative transposase